MSTPPPASPYGPYNPDPNTPYGQQLARRRRQGAGGVEGEAEAVAEAAMGRPVPPGSSHLVDAGQDFFGKLERGVREIVDETERSTRGFGRRKRDARKLRKKGQQ
ncbi:hypothetical protein [Streptomyces iconiensis]|uniref:Uncharacterized protein n=1 Tax=Streptomyces iconiensis TaxID=1384038 RepID=A0ABT7A6W1_9ACTN|nr:hypothetical protein [Streptomyces iconiensis]MDJ1136571.1 hypothetical protein [Streptomyces iconiensis]